MAVRDLLWACPRCGRQERLDSDGRCGRCGTVFRRGEGARIVAESPAGAEETRTAAGWVDELPDPASLLPDEPAAMVREAAVRTRRVTEYRAIHGEHGFLNRVEVSGPREPGTLRLFGDRVTLETGNGVEEWPLERLTAVQASSSSLQLKPRDEPLVSFRFEDDSNFLWEALVRAALRALYRRQGRGTIVEFQPRICTDARS